MERTWQERICILESLGFIRTAKRGLDDHAYVLLVDPHIAILQLEGSTFADTTQRQTFDHWVEQFRLLCEQWGVDLEAYRVKLAELAAPEGAMS